MNKLIRFQEIFHFLKKYQSVHEREYLRRYPNSYEDFINPWIDELMDWDLKQLADFESYPNEANVNDIEFKLYLRQIKTLTDIEKQIIKETQLAPEYLRRLNPKKKHEVQTLRTFIDEHSQTQTLIDIGGGAGHLSCALLGNTDKRSICVDMDSKLQDGGLNKIQKWHPHIKDQIKFVERFFNSETQLDEKYDENQSSVIGLHSCGPLSTSLIQYGVENDLKEIISLGCCYHKLVDEYNISEAGKNNNLKFTDNALHLAGRSSAVIDELDLQKRFKIKSYRYALHYFLYDNWKLPFYSVGNSKPSDFEKDFAHYAKKYHKGDELNEVSDEQLNIFFDSKTTQDLIKKNFLADMIRMQFGRVIEVYLLIDRALYLKDNGREVEVTEIFDRTISPRNIMIFSRTLNETE